MTIRILLSLTILWCVISNQAQAEDCLETAITTAEMNECAHIEKTESMKELEEVYDKLMAKIRADSKHKLKLAKAAWEEYRKKQCDFDTYGTIDGSVHPMIVSECYTSMANDYKEVLLEQFNCEEGNLSCGNQ